tara:strand:+ start:1123 stop:1272 length:150 start_codon:yes stop_codon:yes gene_type:complete
MSLLNKSNKKKLKRMESDIRSIKHILELIRTIIPVLVLFLQVIILIHVI